MSDTFDGLGLPDGVDRQPSSYDIYQNPWVEMRQSLATNDQRRRNPYIREALDKEGVVIYSNDGSVWHSKKRDDSEVIVSKKDRIQSFGILNELISEDIISGVIFIDDEIGDTERFAQMLIEAGKYALIDISDIPRNLTIQEFVTRVVAKVMIIMANLNFDSNRAVIIVDCNLIKRLHGATSDETPSGVDVARALRRVRSGNGEG